MIVIAVPVMYSAWMNWANPITPEQSSHLPNARKLARSRIEAVGTTTMSLRILMVMIKPAFPCILTLDPS